MGADFPSSAGDIGEVGSRVEREVEDVFRSFLGLVFLVCIENLDDVESRVGGEVEDDSFAVK